MDELRHETFVDLRECVDRGAVVIRCTDCDFRCELTMPVSAGALLRDEDT